MLTRREILKSTLPLALLPPVAMAADPDREARRLLREWRRTKQVQDAAWDVVGTLMDAGGGDPEIMAADERAGVVAERWYDVEHRIGAYTLARLGRSVADLLSDDGVALVVDGYVFLVKASWKGNGTTCCETIEARDVLVIGQGGTGR